MYRNIDHKYPKILHKTARIVLLILQTVNVEIIYYDFSRSDNTGAYAIIMIMHIFDSY